MNFPIVTRAEVVNGFLEVEATLNTAPASFIFVFIFANSECDPTGFGEGERFLSEVFAQGGGNNPTFSASIPLDEHPVYDGEFITTSASNPESTSEFSECVAIVGAPSPTPTPAPTLEGTPRTWGDLDCTNGINTADVLQALRVDAGLENVQPPGCPVIGDEVQVNGVTRIWGDVDCSTAFNLLDSLKSLREDAGLPADRPVGCPDMGELVFVVI